MEHSCVQIQITPRLTTVDPLVVWGGREGEQWYVVFACEVEALPMEKNQEAIGIDLGLLHFATLSDGHTIENPRFYRKAEKKLKGL